MLTWPKPSRTPSLARMRLAATRSLMAAGSTPATRGSIGPLGGGDCAPARLGSARRTIWARRAAERLRALKRGMIVLLTGGALDRLRRALPDIRGPAGPLGHQPPDRRASAR